MLEGWKLDPTGGYCITKDGSSPAHCWQIARQALELTYDESDVLFSSDWHPEPGVSVPVQLRRYAAGDPIPLPPWYLEDYP